MKFLPARSTGFPSCPIDSEQSAPKCPLLQWQNPLMHVPRRLHRLWQSWAIECEGEEANEPGICLSPEGKSRTPLRPDKVPVCTCFRASLWAGPLSNPLPCCSSGNHTFDSTFIRAAEHACACNDMAITCRALRCMCRGWSRTGGSSCRGPVCQTTFQNHHHQISAGDRRTTIRSRRKRQSASNLIEVPSNDFKKVIN